jgi:hypothetical protein
MVRFKTIKFKHYRKARALTAREEEGENIDTEYLTFAISLVAEWDFVDEETGEALPIEAASLDELSLEQMTELASLFNRKFGDLSAVKKTTDAPSPSILIPSNLEERAETSRSGSVPSSSQGD